MVWDLRRVLLSYPGRGPGPAQNLQVVSGLNAIDVFIQVRLYMMNIGWFSRSSNQQPSSARVQRIAGGFGVAILLMTTGIAVAQNPAADTPAPGTQMSVPNGYSVHSSVDFGGRIADVVGSGAMYDSLIESADRAARPDPDL